MPNCIVFMFIVMSILLWCVSSKGQIKEDMCGITVDVLCVKDVLSDIAKAAKEIHTIADKIENEIFKRDPTKTRLINNINGKMTILRSSLPTSKYHNRSSQMNNIDKNDFIFLIKEENDAVTYLYISVKNLLHTESIFGGVVDNLFDNIQNILHNRMLCNYRNILRVYSENWIAFNQIDGIQIPKTRKRELTSLTYNTYSIIMVRLLRGWMKSVDNFIENLEKRLI